VSRPWETLESIPSSRWRLRLLSFRWQSAWARSGRFPGLVEVNGRYYVRRAAFERWLDGADLTENAIGHQIGECLSVASSE
jgi:hypothetical protein